MNNTPLVADLNKETARRRLLQTALLGVGVFLAPVVLACLFVFAFNKLSAGRPAGGIEPVALTNRLADASITNLTELLALAREGRAAGFATEEVNLRIWAAQAAQPATLFRIAPPDAGKRWNWHLSQDGRYAVAASVEVDELGRRQTGLYDLFADDWVWKNTLPWPDAHEPPYVFNRNLVLRYVKNATRFALEIDPEGRIRSLDKLGRSAFPLAQALPPTPSFPGTPVAVRNGVFFATDPDRQRLVAYALERLPGLRYAGKADDNTLFSGNGLLKFSLQDGNITVSDSLTQTVLQRVAAWRPATNVVVTGALTTSDGSGLNVFLKADFGGTPAVSREWVVALATYTGTVMPSFSADALLSNPRRTRQRQAVSRDNRWLLSVNASNELTVACQADKRTVAKVGLGALLGVRQPISHIAFLEEGRHLVLLQGGNAWLLDFTAACGYADLLARLTASGDELARAAQAAATHAPPAVANAAPAGDLYAADAPETRALPAPAALALRAELLAAHQAWPYAAGLLERCEALTVADGRAPRVNPLLLARAQILSGQRQQARATCRKALLELIDDPSAYNRMIRYHLQGLLFAP